MTGRTVVVLAGGRGTRLATVTGPDLPKALVPVAGRPFIDWKIDELHAAGATEVVVLVGHHGDAIAAHLAAHPPAGLAVVTRDDGAQPLGTGGAVRAALDQLPRQFWVTYGDSLMTVDLDRGERIMAETGSPASMTVWHNRDALGPSNALVRGNRVVAYSKDPTPPGAEHIDYGMLALDAAVFDAAPAGAFDLADLLTGLAARGSLAACAVDEPFRDIGTPEALDATETHLRARGQ
jgi:NDP-sugar pyrophosphorylase family protein